MPIGRNPNHRDAQLEPGPAIMQYPETSAGVLQEIAVKCGAKVAGSLLSSRIIGHMLSCTFFFFVMMLIFNLLCRLNTEQLCVTLVNCNSQLR